jgi:hypothetical protein
VAVEFTGVEMNVTHAAHVQKQKQLHRKLAQAAEDEQLTRADYADGGVVALQQLIGNRGVQRLIAQGQFPARKVGLPPVGGVVRRKCSCGCCNGAHEEQEEPTAAKGEQIQRWWDDEEESEDDGGSWTDWVSDTAEDAVNTVESWFGEDEESEDDGGSWWDSEEESETESDSDEGSWWDFGEDEESESESEDESDSWTDWFDWSDDSDEEVHEIPEVNVDCLTDEGVGFGGSISLHGRTDANYDHAQPIPAPFPSSVTVTTGDVGGTPVFSASGTFDVTFKANPSITLPSVPSGLTECQEKAVRDFINGPLAAHEQDHANAFTNNYDGTFTAKVNVKNIKDTPDQRQAAMDAPVQKEDVARVTKANAASKKLDPWNQTIPGLDCED